MPAKFDKCRRQGGKIRTKSIGHGAYIHICIPKHGPSVGGEVKHKKRGR